MGRALADRALLLAAELGPVDRPRVPGLIDLTRPCQDEIPPHIARAAKDALDRGETHYTTRPGIVPLRQAIAARQTADGFPTTADNVVVTNGAAEACYIALQTLLAPGARLLAPDPLPPNLAAMVRFLGADLVRLPTEPSNRFLPTGEAIATAGADVLLLANPSPVTGVAIPPPDLARLAAAALGAGTAVVLDRALATACFDPALARFPDPDLGARLVTLGSFSTGHGLAGWRVGWFSAPEAQIPKLRELKQAMSICTTAVSQWAALAALEGPTGWYARRRTRFAALRDEVAAHLAGANLRVLPADAFPPLLVDTRAIDPDDRRVVARLRDEVRVVVAPGSIYGEATAGLIRIDLETSPYVLGAGGELLCRLARGGTR